MKTFKIQFQQHVERRWEHFQDWLNAMTLRERVMVIFTLVFVAVSLIGSALFYMHRAADVQQQRLNQLKDTLVWMQSQAVTLQVSPDQQLSLAEKVQRAAQQQGFAVSAQQNGEEMLIQATHANYVVLANFLTQLIQMGLTIEKLELSEASGQIKLSAAVL